MKKLFVIGIALLMFSCTDNNRAKHWGGTETIKMKPNEVVLNATWKKSNLWLFIKDTTTNETYFQEHSNYGIMEGKIEFK